MWYSGNISFRSGITLSFTNGRNSCSPRPLCFAFTQRTAVCIQYTDAAARRTQHNTAIRFSFASSSRSAPQCVNHHNTPITQPVTRNSNQLITTPLFVARFVPTHPFLTHFVPTSIAVQTANRRQSIIEQFLISLFNHS